MVSAAKDATNNARGWYIPGVTEPPSDTAYTVKSNQQVISMAVFVTEQEKAWVWDSHEDLQAYCKKHALPMPAEDQKKPAAMNALEMQYACTAFLEHCTDKGTPVQAIVLDRATWHTAEALHQALEDLGVRVVLLPPRSHELSPLDNGFFGVVDSMWDRWRRGNASKPWQAQKEKLRSIIHSVQPEPFVKAWVENIIQCIVTEGKRWLKQ
jgi:hypothetical protein